MQAEPADIIRNLKFYRKKAGLTQKEPGARAGIHPISICLYENGKHKPRRGAAERLVDVPGVILAGIPNPPSTRHRGADENCIPAGSSRTPCPHCGAPNCHFLEAPVAGVSVKCIACSREFRLDGKPLEQPKARKTRDAFHKEPNGERI